MTADHDSVGAPRRAPAEGLAAEVGIAGSPRRTRLAVATAVLVGTLASGGAAWAQHQSSQRATTARVATVVLATGDAVDARLDGVETATSAARALLQSSDEVTATEFVSFSQSLSGGRPLPERYPGLTGLAFVDAAGGGVPLSSPAAAAEDLTDVVRDEPALRSAMEQATRLALPVSAVLPPDALPGGERLAVVVAVFDDARATAATATADSRREGLRGWVLGMVDVQTLTTGALPPGTVSGRLEITGPDDELLASQQVGGGEPAAHRRVVLLNRRGTALRLTVEVGPSFVSATERWAALPVLAVGLLLTAAVAALVWLLSSQRRRALAMVHEATDELARSNQRLRQFAGVVAHDLKSPLTSVRGFMSLALRRQAAADEMSQDLLSRALEGTTRMAELIDDLLTYAEAGADIGELEPVELSPLVQGVIETLADHRAPGDMLAIEVEAAVLGHPASLRRLFSNLIRNAMKFRREGEPSFLQVLTRRVGDRLEVSVIDDGIGIPAEDRTRVLAPFERSAGDREGTGLGLSICKRIVEAHGGTIAIDEAPGGGTVVTFDLPAAD